MHGVRLEVPAVEALHSLLRAQPSKLTGEGNFRHQRGGDSAPGRCCCWHERTTITTMSEPVPAAGADFLDNHSLGCA